MAEMINIDPKDVKALMEYYGYEDSQSDLPFDSKSEKLTEYVESLVNESFHQSIEIELFQLIKLFNSCVNSPLKITSTITKPRAKDNEIKNTESTITISEPYLLAKFRQFVTSLFGMRYHYEIDAHGCCRISPFRDYRASQMSSFRRYPYCQSILDALIDEVEEKKVVDLYPKRKITKNCKLGGYAEAILAYLLRHDFYEENKTKRYSFVFDLMRLGGKTGRKNISDKGFSGDVGREKCENVRSWLNALMKYYSAIKE